VNQPPTDAVLLVLVTFVIVNVAMLVRSVARSGRPRFGTDAGRQPTDALAALDDVATWGRRITGEGGGGRPYPRPVSIVRIELAGLAALDGAQGEAAGDRLVGAMADTLRQLARDTDHVARLGRGGFGVIMPGTPDDAASTYVSRVKRAFEPWLQPDADAVGPVIGWATTSGNLDLVDVELAAMRRMRAGTGRVRTVSRLLPSVR
jgi:GGDEF domain-containing protein